jgi:hypothetical protein
MIIMLVSSAKRTGLDLLITMFYRSFIYKRSNLLFIDFYVPVLTSRLKCTETLLQFSENITFFAVCHIYTGVSSKET